MLKRLMAILLGAALSLVPAALTAQDYPRQRDVATIDGIVSAFFEIVSTPAGQLPDRERDASLHAPDARIRISGRDREGRPTIRSFTLEEFHAAFYPAPAARPFAEREIHRVMQRHGNIAHVWSTYEMTEGPGGKVIGRGITSLQLYNDGARWWITGWMDENESPASTIAEEYLPRGE